MLIFLQLKFSFFFLLLIWCTNLRTIHTHGDNIITSSGLIKGTEIELFGRRIKQYLGIPFAKPPVGDLRFQKPQPVENHDQIVIADTMPPACIQYMENPCILPWYDFQDGKSEDCLYLNIWTPQSSLKINRYRKIPVMVFIYGGGFTIGSNRLDIYNGKVLAAKGGIVVVTMNFRMGTLGFLTSGTKEAPGNVGMYDILEALKWVNKNIHAFGGHPDQVTLVGQGSGAQSISLLCVSPLAKGLFHRVIMESGSAAYLAAENNTANIDKSQRIAETVGCSDENTNIYNDPNEVVNCLRDVPALELTKAVSSFHLNPALTFFPNYGDEILPQNARIALIEGDFHNVDVFIGNVHDERALQTINSHPDIFGLYGEKDPKINKSSGETLLRDALKDFPNAEEAIDYYLGKLSEDDYDNIRYQVYTAAGDYGLLCPNVYFAESYSRINKNNNKVYSAESYSRVNRSNKVYFYFFLHRSSTTKLAEWAGVPHLEEVQFVFGLPLLESANYTKEEVRLSKNMIKIWTNFVKHGDPGYSWWPWPLYSRENPVYYELSTNFIPRLAKGPHKKNCDFFRKYFGFP